jgi:hypothetical protein
MRGSCYTVFVLKERNTIQALFLKFIFGLDTTLQTELTLLSCRNDCSVAHSTNNWLLDMKHLGLHLTMDEN